MMKKRNMIQSAILGCATLLLAGSLQASQSTANPDTEQPQDEMAGETAIAGAALTLDKYCFGDWVYDSDEIYDLLFEEPSTEESTEESTDESTEESTEESSEVPTETVPETVPAYSGLVICQADKYVNIRTEATTAAPIVGKIYKNAVGEAVTAVNGEDGVWYHIQSGTVTGYVKAEYFVAGEEAEALLPSVSSLIGVVNAVNLRVRSTPTTADDSNILTKITFGTTVVIAGEEGDFYRIQMDESFFGYIHKDYVDVTYKYKEAISLDEERLQAELEYERQQQELIEESIQASIQESIEASIQESIDQSIAQQESIEAAGTVIKITARYVGSQKYSGDVVTAADIEVAIHFEDGHVEKNLPGWSSEQCNVPLSTGEVKIVITYGGYSTGLTITVLERSGEVTTPPATEPPTETPTQPPATEPPATEPSTQPPATEPPATEPSGSEYDVLREQLKAYAMQFLGNPYVYGGTDLINGTDCSGFTMRVYQHFGISITRTSRSQAQAGREISLDNLRVGDLLFYDTNGRISHVAMYIGNGQIIHAANETLGICIFDAFYRMPCKAVTFLDTPS